MADEVVFEDDEYSLPAQSVPASAKSSGITHAVISSGIAKTNQEALYLLITVMCVSLFLTGVVLFVTNKTESFPPAISNPAFQKEFSIPPGIPR